MREGQEFQLSERLKMIASHVSPGDTAADIGTDHGYIPIWLLSSGITDRVILTDINEGPLRKARNNIQKWLPETVPDLRQGPGLSVLNPGEAEVLMIAGMGGILISRILEADPEIVSTALRLVLQPRNHAYTLRKYLRGLREFVVSDEQIAVEAGRFCEIITLTRRDLAPRPVLRMEETIESMEKEMNLGNRIYDEVPVMYALTGKYQDYLDYKCEAERQVIRNIVENGRTDYAEKRRRRAESRLAAFQIIRERQSKNEEKR